MAWPLWSHIFLCCFVLLLLFILSRSKRMQNISVHVNVFVPKIHAPPPKTKSILRIQPTKDPTFHNLEKHEDPSHWSTLTFNIHHILKNRTQNTDNDSSSTRSNHPQNRRSHGGLSIAQPEWCVPFSFARIWISMRIWEYCTVAPARPDRLTLSVSIHPLYQRQTV